jgi:hypothetical protein
MSPNVFKQGLSLSFGIWIRDDRWPPGCGIPDNDRVYPEPVEGMRFRVRSKREIRRVKSEPVIGCTRRSAYKIRTGF